MLLSQYQRISIFSTYICIVAFFWDFRSTFWPFQCYNMGGGNNLGKWRKSWNFITAHNVKFCIHYNTNNVEFSQSFVFCFHFFLVGQSKRVHRFLQTIWIDGKKESRRKERRKGKRVDVCADAATFHLWKPQMQTCAQFLLFSKWIWTYLDPGILWLIYLKMSVPFWRDRHLDSNTDK